MNYGTILINTYNNSYNLNQLICLLFLALNTFLFKSISRKSFTCVQINHYIFECPTLNLWLTVQYLHVTIYQSTSIDNYPIVSWECTSFPRSKIVHILMRFMRSHKNDNGNMKIASCLSTFSNMIVIFNNLIYISWLVSI